MSRGSDQSRSSSFPSSSPSPSPLSSSQPVSPPPSSPSTRQYYLIGGDVSASPSPMMMNAAFAALSLDARYTAVSISGGDSLAKRFSELTGADFGGMNVTIPFKSAVIPFLGGLDALSSRIGAVNVIKREDGALRGYNTDALGITRPLKPFLDGLLDHAVLLGAGGAARAFVEAMWQLGCRRVSVFVRDTGRAAAFLNDMKKEYKMTFQLYAFDQAESFRQDDYTLLFNATPMGSRGIELPDALRDLVRPEVIVFDAVYRPMETDLVKDARQKSCRVVHGYEMLLQQGAAAFEIWTGKRAPVQVMEEALLASLGERTTTKEVHGR